MRKIFLWGYWARNFGDDLFLKVYIEKIRSYRIKTYILTSKRYRKFYQNMGFNVICSDSLLYRVSYKILVSCGFPELYYLLIKKNSLFVMLGGSLFAENKGNLAETRQIKNLRWAVRKSKKAFVIGSNFGPYNSKAFYEAYKSLFNKTYDVCFRDKKSFDLFKTEVQSVRYASDIAFEGNWKEAATDECESVVVSILNLEQRPGLSQHCKLYEDVISEIVKQHLTAGEKVTLLSLCETEGDLIACDRISKRVYAESNMNAEVVNYENIDEVVGLISKAKKIYATRFHALMLSLYFQKNVVPIIYNEKGINALETYCKSIEWFKISDFDDTTAYKLYHTNQLAKLKLANESQFQQLTHYCDQEWQDI